MQNLERRAQAWTFQKDLCRRNVKVAWKKLFSKWTGGHGTLAYFTLLGRVAVTKKSKKAVNACMKRSSLVTGLNISSPDADITPSEEVICQGEGDVGRDKEHGKVAAAI